MIILPSALSKTFASEHIKKLQDIWKYIIQIL